MTPRKNRTLNRKINKLQVLQGDVNRIDEEVDGFNMFLKEGYSIRYKSESKKRSRKPKALADFLNDELDENDNEY